MYKAYDIVIPSVKANTRKNPSLLSRKWAIGEKDYIAGCFAAGYILRVNVNKNR